MRAEHVGRDRVRVASTLLRDAEDIYGHVRSDALDVGVVAALEGRCRDAAHSTRGQHCFKETDEVFLLGPRISSYKMQKADLKAAKRADFRLESGAGVDDAVLSLEPREP